MGYELVNDSETILNEAAGIGRTLVKNVAEY